MGIEYVNTGSGVGYHASCDVYKDGEKVRSEAYRTTITGKGYVDVYDGNGKKIDSYYT